ncbi:putative 3'-5' exonuclease related to the exonuclease domain of PolB [Rubripirellula lacrimiformis]|uniref:Putative 3'-5' exonuclease related to the exonuclease domain of PolB n=1 Tax=Rubripirellula lacrimiformis TaxID=1930273 RepID=A0A517N3S7_9BACT|nr:3'-5' exonuclease [Rubripirellula lacrimiformis]QDT01792.1 putative 3'-5' exonuclease related to the exonuclease domain of PolB [Rubripirellula lacrimiformis]
MVAQVSYLIFDVESVADGELVSRIRYPGMDYSPQDAIATYQDELMETRGTTFIPHTFQLPVAVVVAKVSADFRLVDVVSLDEPEFRPHVITQSFWRGWDAYKYPTWVTFNGRSFDVPLMELAAYRFGISLPKWFRGDGYKAPRNRYNTAAHLDLQDVLTNFGAARCNGGLNLVSQMLGKPGKMDLTGDQVQQQHNEGNKKAISDYCRCDVLDTYFVFLRTRVLTGNITLDQEIQLVAEAKQWIEERAPDCEAYRDYLGHWREWANPWAIEVDPKADTDDVPESATDAAADAPVQAVSSVDSESPGTPSVDAAADPKTDESP